MKICTKCQIAKDLLEFQRDSKGKDGRRARCKVCCNTKIRETVTSLLQEISQKHGCFLNISMNRDGTYHVQLFTAVRKHWKGKDLIEILQRMT